MLPRALVVAMLAFGTAVASPADPPIVASAIIEIEDAAEPCFILIERSHAPMGRALPGFRLCAGESVEASLRRGIKQVLDCELADIRLFQVYSDPTRDPNGRSIEIVHIAKLQDESRALQLLQASGMLFKEATIPWDSLVYDHAEIIRDYLDSRTAANTGSQ